MDMLKFLSMSFKFLVVAGMTAILEGWDIGVGVLFYGTR